MSCFRKTLKWLLFPGWIAFFIIGVVALVVLLGMATYEEVTWRTSTDWDLFRSECGKCHDYSRPQGFAHAPSEWEKTVHRMLHQIPENERTEKPGDRKRISNLLKEIRSTDGAALIRDRCGKCHSSSVLNPYKILDSGTLELLVRQHVRLNNFAIHVWEGDLIVQEILDQQSSQQNVSKDMQNTSYRFQEFCGLCHTVRFLYRDMCQERRSDSDWEEVAVRMHEKAPDAATESEMTDMAKWSRNICTQGFFTKAQKKTDLFF